MTRLGRLEFGLERAVRFRRRPLWTRYCQDDPRTLTEYGLAWVGELSWLGLVLDLRLLTP